MSGGDILQTPGKTYLTSDSGNSSCLRLWGSVKDVTYFKNLLKKANGKLHTAVEVLYEISLSLPQNEE